MKINLSNIKKNIISLDWVLLLPVILLCSIGILFIYSSGVTSEGYSVQNEYLKQIFWFISGLGLCFLFSIIDYKNIKLYCFQAYLIIFVLLAITLIFGQVVNGSKSWLRIAGFGLQPSEFSKLITIIFLASFLEDYQKESRNILLLLVSIIIVLLPMGLILLQPDMGTALVFIPILIVMIFLSGVRIHYIIFMITIGIISILLLVGNLMRSEMSSFWLIFSNPQLINKVVLGFLLFIAIFVSGYLFLKHKAWYWSAYFTLINFLSYILAFVGSKILKGYQLNRLIIFLDPYVDERGAGWNIIQSMNAVGSGGFWGKGFLQGTQSHSQYIPEQSTDFIFSIIAEEWGFAGSFLIIALFTIVIIRIFYISIRASDRFGSLIGAGIIGMFIYHVIENIGMAISIMPVTGIPLPFVSYGGTALWTSLCAIGILNNINKSRYRD